jgi:filamentous hemagglutinin family protein
MKAHNKNRRMSSTLTALLIAATSVLSMTGAEANPTSGQVTAGQATIASSGSTLTVTQSTSRAIINWQTFSIAAGETTKFLQPSATSAVLNRVISNNPSALYGTLSANGQVYLINANGILIGPNGVVNTRVSSPARSMSSTRNSARTNERPIFVA